MKNQLNKKKGFFGNTGTTSIGPLTWRKRASELRGYQRAMYLNADNGDFLRVDFNLSTKLVRLYLEVEDEGGNAYYSVIKDGEITSEKSVASGRYFGFSEKFTERAHIFSSIPSLDVLKIIGNNYNIGRRKAHKKPRYTERKKALEKTRRKYFISKNDTVSRRGEFKLWEFLSRHFIDVIDVIVCAAVGMWLFVYFQYSFIALGVVTAFFGISIGFVDMFFRERNPVFAKIAFFLILGTAFYVYDYFLT